MKVVLKLVGYIRVSRIGGRAGDGYISPDVQREAIEAYAAELGGEIAHWADDQDYSGGEGVERPDFQDALERIRRDELDGIVVMKIDRFSRSTADGMRIVRELVDADKIFASCHERIDVKTPEGRYMLAAFFSNGELFLDQRKADWIIAKSRAISRGVPMGKPPIGYRKAKSQPLEIDPVAGPAITELFRRAASGREGPTELRNFFDARVPPAGRSRSPTVIKRWLSNRVYLGEIRYGEMVNLEAHPPLTDERTWLACQSEPGRRFQPPEAFLLSGLIRCAFCRYAMGGNSRGGFNRDTPIYRCTSRCAVPCVITASKVENYVRDRVKTTMQRLELEAVEAGDDLIALTEALEAAEAELQAFLGDLQARRILGEAEWQVALQIRVQARDDARRALEEAQSRRQLLAVVDIDSLSRHQLRGLFQGLMRGVFIRRGRGGADERVLIVWSDDAPVEIPGPNRGAIYEPIEW